MDTTMNITPEQFSQLLHTLQTKEGADTSMLVFTGILALSAIILIVWLILNFRLKPVERLDTKIDQMQMTLQELSGKLWKAEDIDLRIENRIQKCIDSHEKVYHVGNMNNTQPIPLPNTQRS